MNNPIQQLDRYQHLPQIGMKVNKDLVSLLSKEDTHEGGRMLGILKRDVLVFDNEAEMDLLMDFCIHEIRRNGLTAVDRLLEEDPYPSGSDMAMILNAHKQAYFTGILFESSELGVGVHAFDVVRDESCFIHDVGFSQTTVPGVLLAARLINPDNILMSTGTALPIGAGLKKSDAKDAEIFRMLKSYFGGNKRPVEMTAGGAAIIRAGLELGASSQVAYAGTPRGAGRMPQSRFAISPPPTHTPKPPPGVGRYDPCPCGSGKKYKFCCGARR